MYAVIFKAHINRIDDEYLQTAKRLRELALKTYGCMDFVSVTEDDREISVSYWNSREDIARWKQDPQHLEAQHRGRSDWYRNYTVEIVEIKQQYSRDKKPAD